MKIYYSVPIVIILGVFLLIWGSKADENTLSAHDIYTKIDEGEIEIDLTALADFEWTHVHTFGPYTTDDMIEEATDIEFKFLFGGIDVTESNFLLVFANEKKAVKTLYLSRQYGDYFIKENQFLVVEK